MTNQSSKTSLQGRMSHRSAFTLVELLVVIVIIGLLVAILLPVVNGVRYKVQASTIAVEIANIGAQVQQFKTQYGNLPPDMTAGSPRSAQEHQRKSNTVAQVLGQAFRYRDTDNRDGTIDVPYNPFTNQYVNFTDLDCAEALVFWLSGFSDNQQYPLTGKPFVAGSGPIPVLYFPNDEQIKNGAQQNVFVPEKTPLFDFDKSRLKDIDKDGFPEYYPRYGNQSPYIYYSNASYKRLFRGLSDPLYQESFNLNFNNPPTVVPKAPAPYLTTATPVINSAGVVQNIESFAESDKFQIISAGIDGLFASYNLADPSDQQDKERALYAYPNGPYRDKTERDNITNFAAGTLESQIP